MLNWKLIRKSLKFTAMRKKILAIVGVILVYRFLANIPLPLDNAADLQEALETYFNNQDALSLLNSFSGGALGNFSIVALGLGPYINASIVMQLVVKAIPSLEEKQKEGEDGRRKINQYTRLLSVPFALAQSIALLFIVNQQVLLPSTGNDFIASASPFEWLLILSAMTAGSVLMMWMGELLTEQNMGNGITLLIIAGIAASIPSTFTILWETIRQGWNVTYNVFDWFTVPFNLSSYLIVLGILISIVATTYFIVKLNEAYRIVTVSYAKRVQGASAYGGVESILPIKLLLAGVIPIIFAFTFLAAPSLLASIFVETSNGTLQNIGNFLNEYFPQQQHSAGIQTGWVYPLTSFVLVVAFTYFYTNMQFNAKSMAEDLQKKGGFIAGVRPGVNTEKHLNRIVNRLTLFGGVSLGFLTTLPIVVQNYLPNIAQISLTATSIIILVSGGLEIMRQVESNALVVTYDDE